jgi:hypothetical protein
LLLDRAALPACNVYLPNLTSMAALVEELLGPHSTARWINAVLVGRVLHRAMPGFLKWHGSIHLIVPAGSGCSVFIETTIYRFPEVRRVRQAFMTFISHKKFGLTNTTSSSANNICTIELDAASIFGGIDHRALH